MKAKSGAWAAGVLALAVVAGGGLYWKFGGASHKGQAPDVAQKGGQ